ncbi:hypothetical protein HGRIS_011811 [Hohenbuehelia grisea]|uniref:Uncharacterized protein n=1 Tax=Hohenbuehelia grisea TaxID=104357 RepID=A0ABR3JWF2_9AGAR
MNPTTVVARLFVSLTLLSSLALALPQQYGDRPVGMPSDEDLPPGAVDGCWPVYYTTTVTPTPTGTEVPIPIASVGSVTACA